ncbi:hypothetical protein [Gordonia hydrophobica]|uniref:Uncharacterized protein n=1 Tax=Gordonia hydrophobica TaxID=40516 RepID=A0ABZ2U3F0_9ACTN|nr:hypothetical protein [Gordonia hydrophobica]MBM7367511.1 hypothetical protein [Gordonia hydrophobica]
MSAIAPIIAARPARGVQQVRVVGKVAHRDSVTHADGALADDECADERFTVGSVDAHEDVLERDGLVVGDPL